MSFVSEIFRILASQLNNPKDGKKYCLQDNEYVELPDGGGGGVQSVTGQGVGGTASDAFDTANANVTTINTDALGLEADGVHYNAAASKAMGITLHG